MTVTGSLLLVLLLPGLASLLLPLLEAVQVLLLTSGQHLQEDGVFSSVIQTWSRTKYIHLCLPSRSVDGLYIVLTK